MQKKHHTGSKVAAGFGLAALAAAAAGAIYLYGTDDGAKRRKQIKSWSLRMRADVIDRMEKMKDWSEQSYKNIVDDVARKYRGVKSIDRSELNAIVDDLKKHWKNLKRHVESGGKPAKKRSSKSTTSEKSEGETAGEN